MDLIQAVGICQLNPVSTIKIQITTDATLQLKPEIVQDIRAPLVADVGKKQSIKKHKNTQCSKVSFPSSLRELCCNS